MRNEGRRGGKVREMGGGGGMRVNLMEGRGVPRALQVSNECTHMLK